MHDHAAVVEYAHRNKRGPVAITASTPPRLSPQLALPTKTASTQADLIDKGMHTAQSSRHVSLSGFVCQE